MAGITVSFICINDCVTCLSQLPDHAKVSDPAEDYILCLSSVLVLSRVSRTFFKMYMLAMVLRTTPWSKSPSDTFDVDDGGCFGCWHVLLVMCFLLSSTIFWVVVLLTPMSAAVLSHTRFIPDFFSSMQNVYTFSITAAAIMSICRVTVSKHYAILSLWHVIVLKHYALLHICQVFVSKLYTICLFASILCRNTMLSCLFTMLLSFWLSFFRPTGENGIRKLCFKQCLIGVRQLLRTFSIAAYPVNSIGPGDDW